MTIKDVAAAAGVSTATVSRVLSGRRPVSPEIAQVVRAASDRLGYSGNAVARSLRMQWTGTVGMIVPRISNPFFPAIVEAVERELAVEGHQLFLCDSQGSVEQEAARLDALLARRVDGLLVVPCESDASSAAITRAAVLAPVVEIDRRTAAPGTDFVGVDNVTGMELVMDHLLAAGARTFAFVSASELTSPARTRAEVYQRRVRDARGAGGTRCLLGDFSYEWGRRAADALVADGALPDAVVCGADVIALGLVSGLHSHGVDVPGQVRVTGFDDIGVAELSNPGLTSVRQPVEDIGRNAVHLLRSRTEDRTRPGRSVVLPPTLMVRSSSAPC